MGQLHAYKMTGNAWRGYLPTQQEKRIESKDLKKSLSEVSADTAQQLLIDCHIRINLEQWFSTQGDFAPQGPLPHLETHFGVTIRGLLASSEGSWLAFSGHRPDTLLNILQPSQTAPPNKAVQPKMSVLLKLRSSVLEIWKAEYMKHYKLEIGLFRSEKYINTKILIKCVSGYLLRMLPQKCFSCYLCQLDWATECPDNWSHILVVSVSMIFYEINI